MINQFFSIVSSMATFKQLIIATTQMLLRALLCNIFFPFAIIIGSSVAVAFYCVFF